MARILIPFRHAQKVEPYAAAIRAAAGDAVTLSVSDRPSVRSFGGLLLMGGTDIAASRYGQEPDPENDAPDLERDEVEWCLLDEALERDLPILAICRGLQLLNVHHGGTLRQHLGNPKHDVDSTDKGEPAHFVLLDGESHLAQIYGERRLHVNSRHHQAIDRLGEKLRISARAEDDETIIEGIEQPNRRFLVAVQWHPEDQVARHPEQMRLFRRFAEAVG